MATVRVKPDDLANIYSRLLCSLGGSVDPSTGRVSIIDVDDSLTPCLCKGKPLVVPFDSVLRSPNNDTVTMFHPLGENTIDQNESPVLKKLRDLITLRVNELAIYCLTNLAIIAADPEKQKKLSPTQTDYLIHAGKTDTKTLAAISGINDKLGSKADYKLVAIYQKYGGKLGGQNYSRLAVINFPILKALEKTLYDDESEKEYRLFDVLMRKRDMEIIHALFKYIFPNADQIETYSAGSLSLHAPYFDSLLRAYVNTMGQLLTIIKRFKKVFPGAPAMLADENLNLDVFSDFSEHLSNYIDLIPVFKDNSGESAGIANEQPVPVQASGLRAAINEEPAVNVQVQSKPQANVINVGGVPAVVPVAANHSETGPVVGSFTAAMNAMTGGNSHGYNTAPVIAPVIQQPVMQPVMTHQPVYNHPALNTHLMQPAYNVSYAPAVVQQPSTGRGIAYEDFNPAPPVTQVQTVNYGLPASYNYPGIAAAPVAVHYNTGTTGIAF